MPHIISPLASCIVAPLLIVLCLCNSVDISTAYYVSFRAIKHSSSRNTKSNRTKVTLIHASSLTATNDNNNDVPMSTESPRTLVQKGMQSFRNYDVESSLQYFNQADALANGQLKPYLWQRGISYYYLDQFKEGSDQFRNDVKFNPLDVEEIVWDIACLARMDKDKDGGYPAQGEMMALPKGKKDRRKIMSTVYSLFRNEEGTSEHDLYKTGHDGNSSDEFYSLFYLGL